jgi:hypothetical protein
MIIILFSDGYRTVWRIWFGINNQDCHALTTNAVDMDAFSSSLRSQLASEMEINIERVLYLSIQTGNTLSNSL